MAVCLDCVVINGGDFTAGTATDYCTEQDIFDGGNFTTGTTNFDELVNTCTIDGGYFRAVKVLESLLWGSLIGVKSLPKAQARVHVQTVASDPREPVKVLDQGFITTKTINPSKNGQIVVVSANHETDGYIFIGVNVSGTLKWAPVFIGVPKGSKNSHYGY